MTPLLTSWLAATRPNPALMTQERLELLSERFDAVRLRHGISSDDPEEVLDRVLIFGVAA